MPTGTVTMLFTDIEGSTRLVKELGAGYGELLAEHRRILRGAAAGHGGREMDTQGDAFFFVFARARHAVEAAVQAQRELAAHDWPGGVECRVRMGLHTGEPTVNDEGYHGLGLHRGARIAAAAHGGQILLSSVTADLVQDDLPGAMSLRDLGEQQLKDIDRREHVYQVVAEGLVPEFPPPRTGAPPKQTLGRRRRPAAVAAVCAIVVAVAVVVVVLATQGGSAPSSASAAAVSADSVGIFHPVTSSLVGTIAVGQAGFGAWYADFATPAGFIGSTLTCGAFNRADPSNNTNFSEFCDPAIDREVARAESLQSSAPQAAAQLWTKIDADLVAEAPWVPFANSDVLELVSSRVGNYQFNPQWLTLLDQLWVR